MSQRIDKLSGIPLTHSIADDSLLAKIDFLAVRKAKQELLGELRSAWEAGAPVAPEELLARWPVNPQGDPDVASLLFEDYQLRCQHGEQPEPEEYGRRFPEHQPSLASLSHHQGLLHSLGVAASGGRLLVLPAVGEEVFGFRLNQELGRGSFARVYLAKQIGLADRPVVVKVSAIEGNEPQTLAQLQHTHIVPIYSVHEDVEAGLRVVCMPYFGGASLSRVLEALWAKPNLPVHGTEIAEQICNSQFAIRNLQTSGAQRTADPLSNLDDDDSSTKTKELPIANCQLPIANWTYVRACVWIVARLAEGLQHAHERGVLHRDIKPSNVLLGADGQPMLLDFNLSQNTCDKQAQAEATLGGTVAYMAPEHLRALAARDPALARQVDQRADIYGLGMVLHEVLTGRRPFDQSGSYSPMPAMIEAMAVERGRTLPSLRQHRPDVSWSLESIVRKCLAPDPAQRYQQAEHLAEDLRRYLDDRPLKYAPELSWGERIAKWIRRHPRLAMTGSVALAAALLLAGGAILLVGIRGQLLASQARAHEAEGAEARERYGNFVKRAERARCLLNTTNDLYDHLPDGITVCEQTLGYYGLLEGNRLEDHPTWQRLGREDRLQVAEDARELFQLLARARVKTASPDSENATLERALFLLDQAEAIGGSARGPALWEDRANYLEKLKRPEPARAARERARATPLASARDHYLMASYHAGRSQYAEALAELDQALELNRSHYWSWFNRGNCHYELRRFDLAAADFTACTALWPNFAWGHLNLALALEPLGKTQEALDAYARALKCEPELRLVHANRGSLYLHLDKPSQALDDYDRAIEHGQDDVTVHAGRGIALEKLSRSAEADAAFAQAWKRNPDHISSLVGYAFAIQGRRPKEAQAAFAKVLEREPLNVRALYGYAMLLAQPARDSEQALAYLTLAIRTDPAFVAARRARANVLAHRGDWDQACQDIEWCVHAEPTGLNLYHAACVYALMAQKRLDVPRATVEAHALMLLGEAFRRGYGKATAAEDTDLRSLWQSPEFGRLVEQK
jgi:serine/threonine protein kinase/Tfp pilus assembly protein PilF